MPSFDALLACEFEVSGVVTNPDRPAGRGMELQTPPVKARALEAGIEVFQPQKARSPEMEEWLRRQAPDVAVVVAYGKILPGSLLEVPPLGFVNVHFSILPSYRGAAPVQRAVMDGVAETGVSIMVLSEGMDEGPVLAVEGTPVGEDETGGELGERLAALGGPLLVSALRGYASGELVPHPQDDSAATYAPKITTDEARIDWTEPARRIHNKVRGLDPAPGAWTTFAEKRLKIARVVERDVALPPGSLRYEGGELVAGTGDGAVALLTVQPQGKREMSADEFARGLRLRGGERFE